MGSNESRQLGSTSERTCAHLEGDVFCSCWGRDSDAQLGPAAADAPARGPRIVQSLRNVEELALGRRHSCARLSDGSVVCWGDNAYGALGDGTTPSSRTPVVVVR